MSADRGSGWGIPDSHIFDGRRSRRGYRINKMCISLTKEANRAAFKADEEGYMARFGLDAEARRAVRERDWLRLTELGGNVYFLMKIGACVGHGLYRLGAQQRGETLEEFLATRNNKGAT
ncbi:MAG: protocatechuate 3,4-dioxygenase [Stellaceae bacterium]